MNLETLSFVNQNTPTANESAASVSEQPPEIRQMSMDCYQLVGGGSSIYQFD